MVPNRSARISANILSTSVSRRAVASSGGAIALVDFLQIPRRVGAYSCPP